MNPMIVEGQVHGGVADNDKAMLLHLRGKYSSIS